MKSVKITYPDYFETVLHTDGQQFQQEASFLLALKLFELRRLTSGQAAELAGIPRVKFLMRCGDYGVAAVAWDDEELNAEARPFLNAPAGRS